MFQYTVRKSPTPGGFYAARAPEGRGRFEKKVFKMKRSLDIESRVECTVVRESENPRLLKGSTFSGSLIKFFLLKGRMLDKCKLYSPLGVGGSQTLAKRYTHKFLFLLCLTLLLPACLSKKEYSEEEMQALMDAELQRKIAAYRSSKITACQEEAFRQATKIVDSLVIAEAYFDRDTFARPPKPIKPDEKAPEIKGPDTILLKPLFEGKRKKVKVDTLLKKSKKDTTSRKKN